MASAHLASSLAIHRHHGLPVAADFSFQHDSATHRGTARVPNPKLVRPNPLDGLEEGAAVEVVFDERQPSKALLASLYESEHAASGDRARRS